ncbi:retrovirus-related pol polyprotein from transposon TNT 1-94 [Tanacetum coccineum]
MTFIPQLMHVKQLRRCGWPLNDYSKVSHLTSKMLRLIYSGSLTSSLSRDGESIESYYSRFYKIMNEMVRNQLEVATMQVNVQFLQQLQPEWSKGIEVVNPVTPPSESASDIDSDEENAQKDKQIKKVWLSLQNTSRTSTNLPTTTTSELHQTPGTRIGIRLQGTRMTIRLGNLCIKGRKPKHVKDYTYHKEKMMLCKQEEKNEVLTAESGPTFDVEPLEQVDSNVIPNSSDMCDNEGKANQNAKEYEDERVMLANLKLNTDENKKIQKCISALHHQEIELEKYKSYKDCTIQKDELKNDKNGKQKESYSFRDQNEQYFVIQDLKAQLQDKNIAINELKKLIEKMKGKSVDTKFSPMTNENQNLSKPVTPQILSQTARQAVRNTNVIKPGMYRLDTKPTQTRAPQLPHNSRNTNPRVSTSTGVTLRTSISRPQLKSTQTKDKVVQNNSQVKYKKTEVEDHIFSFSIKTKSATACNDSLKSRNSNVNTIYVTCCNCVLNLNHDACVSKFINDMNAITKKPNVVPIRNLRALLEIFRETTTGNRGSDLYTICLQETSSPTPIYFMAKASPTQAWLWHRRLSHLNFDTINLLSKKDIVNGLPKLKYVKDQLCSSCELGKAKKSSFKIKTIPSSKRQLHLLHMDLSKDETQEVLIDFLKLIQRGLQAQVITVHTERGTKFLNKTLCAYFKEEVIEHQTSIARTPQRNGVVKRWNHTLVEATRTMLSASKLLLFFWAEAISTACYTHNRVYNKRTILIVESIHINFYEIKELSKALDYDNSGPAPQLQKTSDYNRSELGVNDHSNEPSRLTLVPNVSPSTDTYTPPIQELDLLFNPLYEEYFTTGNKSVSKSFALSDNSKQQDTQPTTNV